MAVCKPVDRAVLFDCTAPQQGGVKAELIVMNYEDWLNSTVVIDATSKEITSITLAAGGIQAYLLQVPKSSNFIITQELRDMTYKHIVQAQVNTIEQLDLDMIAKMRTGKVVVIVKLAEGRARVYGGSVNDPDGTPTPAGVGMLLSQDNDIITDPVLGGSSDIILNTPDEEPGEVDKPRLIAETFDVDGLLVATA